MRIDIQTIPHHAQRYPTCGDWYEFEGIWRFRISQLSDWRYEMLILIHELVEWSLCRIAKISVEDVDAFDMNYEEKRPQGDTSEPGDSPDAPYHIQHRVASLIERMAAHFMGVEWNLYEEEVNSL